MKLLKLKGTKTEHDIREQLIGFHHRLFNAEEYVRILNILRDNFPDMKTAYLLYWVPEEGEDIMTFLINNNIITNIEMDRYNPDVRPIIETKPFNDEYIKRLRKMPQITLAVALELANNDMKNGLFNKS